MAEKIITLNEGVLNDDYIVIDGNAEQINEPVKLFFYVFATTQSNTKHKRLFPTLEHAVKWYRTHFMKRVVEQGKEWLREDEKIGVEFGGAPEEY